MAADGSDPQQVTKENFRLLNKRRLDARRRLPRRPQALHLGPVARRGRDVDVPPQRRLRAPPHRAPQRPAGRRRARRLARRPLRLLLRGPDARSSFQYNKDPNAGIYAVRRLDRETGDLQTILSGPGGAARPQPSPDGRHLAFVRRVRDQTALFLADLETGAQRPLVGNLSHDQQETWAIFGVLPGLPVDARQPEPGLLGQRRAPPRGRRQRDRHRHPVPGGGGADRHRAVHSDRRVEDGTFTVRMLPATPPPRPTARRWCSPPSATCGPSAETPTPPPHARGRPVRVRPLVLARRPPAGLHHLER